MIFNFHIGLQEDKVWETFYGAKIAINELSHQHLSNILWYWQLIVKETAPRGIQDELEIRFGGIRLPYRPLISFTSEINVLFVYGYISDKLNSDIIVDGKWVGQLVYN
jgi:hypothetical protein